MQCEAGAPYCVQFGTFFPTVLNSISHTEQDGKGKNKKCLEPEEHILNGKKIYINEALGTARARFYRARFNSSPFSAMSHTI